MLHTKLNKPEGGLKIRLLSCALSAGAPATCIAAGKTCIPVLPGLSNEQRAAAVPYCSGYVCAERTSGCRGDITYSTCVLPD